ncbi:MAG: caspase family protein [Rhizobacter sp.]|nr:caspase family protein [Rhizobacter sp.]
MRAFLTTSVCAAAVGLAPLQLLAQDMVPRISRHALVIGIGHYTDPAIPRLEGIVHDMDSARRMAVAMAIPRENIVQLRDADATAARIRQEIQALGNRVRDGDRVFVYYSGHGTRWLDPTPGQEGCVEGLMAVDGEVLSNRQMTDLLSPLSRKTDKMLVFYDACFSGGMAEAPFRTRSLPHGLAGLTPKFTAVGAPELCATPSNVQTRSLALVMQDSGSVRENVVYVAASRPDEVSFDSAATGGLATSAWRDCFLGGAPDLDGSGAVTVDEVTTCAQARLDETFAKVPGMQGQNMTVAGNNSFVPAWIVPTFVATAATAVEGPGSPSMAPTVPADILAEVHRQRDASRTVDVRLAKQVLRIDQDALQMTIRSNRDGYAYVAIAGSDRKSLYLLYPNERDRENKVVAGETLVLPRASWELVAAGPPGRDTVLVMVTDTPRRLDLLRAQAAGPFMKALLDDSGRSRLQSVLASGNLASSCATAGSAEPAARAGLQSCSDAFGAALLGVEEVW